MSIKSIAVFDLETTGKSVTRDRIVQLSAVKIDRDFNIVSPRRTILINPLMVIPEEATAIHGITNAMVADAQPFSAYAKSLLDYFTGCNLCGYNIKNFDVPLLAEEFGRCGLRWPTMDEKLFDSFRIFSLKEPRTLAGAVKFYTGKIFEDGHDAGRDVDATVDVMKQQFVQYQDISAMNDDDLELFCNEGAKRVDIAGKLKYNEAGVIVYAFGKDQGKSVKENPGFAEWMLKQDFPSDTNRILLSIIKKGAAKIPGIDYV